MSFVEFSGHAVWKARRRALPCVAFPARPVGQTRIKRIFRILISQLIKREMCTPSDTVSILRKAPVDKRRIRRCASVPASNTARHWRRNDSRLLQGAMVANTRHHILQRAPHQDCDKAGQNWQSARRPPNRPAPQYGQTTPLCHRPRKAAPAAHKHGDCRPPKRQLSRNDAA
jgi:hypothetical protein